MKTQAQLVFDVAVKINATGIAQPLSGEDDAYFTSAIQGLVAEMIAARICYLPNLDQIPDLVYEPVKSYLAAMLAEETGGTAPTAQQIELLEDRIKRVTKPMAAKRLLQTDPALSGVNRARGGFNFTNGTST